MEEELKFLRRKVQKLETKMAFMQAEFQDKLSLILERFFNHRTDQIMKQKRALKLEEDVCRDLLSCCTRLGQTSKTEQNFHRGSQTGIKKVAKVKARKSSGSGIGGATSTSTRATSASSGPTAGNSRIRTTSNIDGKQGSSSQESGGENYSDSNSADEYGNFEILDDNDMDSEDIKDPSLLRLKFDNDTSLPDEDFDNPIVEKGNVTKRTSNIGRKRCEVWSHFKDSPLGEPTECNYCGRKVSRQAIRMRKHLQKCAGRHKPLNQE